MPKLYIISGCNGSGKTTASYTLLPELLECREYVNSDEFAKSLSPFDPSQASVRASRFMLMKIKYLMERCETFSIETTLATRSLVNILRQAREKGYEIIVLYFWLSSPQMAIQRVRNRVAAGGHHIPDEVVIRRYYTGLSYLFSQYIPVCDSWILADNSTPPFKVIAQGNRGESAIIRDPLRYDLIRTLSQSAQKLSEENSPLAEDTGKYGI